MSLIGIGILIIVIANLLLGWFVFLRDRKAKANRVFLEMIISFCIWGIGILLFGEAGNNKLSLLGIRIAFGGASLIAPLLFTFSLVFPQQLSAIYRMKYGLTLLPPLFFIFISLFTPLIVKSVELKAWGYTAIYGSLYLFFAGYFLIYISLTIYNLVRQYLRSSGVQKVRFKYLVTGLTGALLIGTTTNLIIPAATGLSKFSRLGPMGTIFFTGLVAYAIIRKELFGIRVILTQILVGAIAILLLVDVIVSETLFEYLWKGALFTAYLVLGYLLIRSVLREIRYRERLQKAYAELKKLDEAKTEFISIASHQLRTPLTAIKGYISMILKGAYGKLPAKTKKPMENVYQSNERLIGLVNNLLNISRIESGTVELEPKPISIEGLISSVVEELKIKAQQKGIYLKWEPSGALPKTKADSDKMRQVVLNVIDNAIRYTKQGGVTIEAKLKLRERKRDRILIIVEDTGEGMTQEEIEHLFERFTRGAVGKKLYTEGVGLGLYVAQQYVAMHDGKIWAKSEGPGTGSTVYIELPVR